MSLQMKNQALFDAVAAYIHLHYVEEKPAVCRSLTWGQTYTLGSTTESLDVKKMLSSLDKPFGDVLLDLIDQKGKTDVEVYKKANIDRKLFSKIRTGNGYMPSKRTVIALALALELTLAETADLLKCAGYALSHSQKFDLIVEYFIDTGNYDVFLINEVLFQHDQPLLGA